MKTSTKRFVWLAAAGGIVALSLWFAHQSRTVERALNRLVVHERVELPGRTVRYQLRPAAEIASDPALAAIVGRGANAVPDLIACIAEPARWAPEEGFGWRIRQVGTSLWNRLRFGGSIKLPAPRNWSMAQRDRKTAAGFALIAIGREAGGGFLPFLEAYAAAPSHTSIRGTPVSGPTAGVSPGSVVAAALVVLPERREELFQDVMAGLRHSAPKCRVGAIGAVREFPEHIAQWKEVVLGMTADENKEVQTAAVHSFVMFLSHRMRDTPDPQLLAELAAAADRILENPNAAEQTREWAQILQRIVREQSY
jgi:hypothetical protein